MKKIITCLFLVLAAATARAADIGEMLAAAVRQPTVAASDIAAREAVLRKEAADSALYPKLNAWSRFESFNSPTNLRPMAPTEVNVPAGEAIPFSREILRYGLSLEAPVYVGEILALRRKSAILADKAQIAHQGKIAGQEAAVVSANSVLLYLAHLDQAIAARLASLEKTRDDLAVKVNSGRSPGAELFKVENSINDLLVQRNDLAARIVNTRRDLEHLTGLDIDAPAPMRMSGQIKKAPWLAEILAEKDLAAARAEVRRRKLARYPKVALYGTISGNDGYAYNTDEHIFRAYNFAGIKVTLPLYDRGLKSDLAVARAGEEKAAQKLADLEAELAAREKALWKNLEILARSRDLQKKSLANAKRLLAIAKASFDAGRTTTEEYLRYESQVLAARAALLATENETWQTRARLASLYGQALDGIVR